MDAVLGTGTLRLSHKPADRSCARSASLRVLFLWLCHVDGTARAKTGAGTRTSKPRLSMHVVRLPWAGAVRVQSKGRRVPATRIGRRRADQVFGLRERLLPFAPPLAVEEPVWRLRPRPIERAISPLRFEYSGEISG